MGRTIIILAVHTVLMIVGAKAQLAVVDNVGGVVDQVVEGVTDDTEAPTVGNTGSSKTVSSVTGGTVPKGGDSSALDGLTDTLTSTTGDGLVGKVLDSTKNLVDGVVGAVAGDTEVPSVGKTGSSKTVKGGDSSRLGGLTGTLTSTTGDKGLVGEVLDSTKNLVDEVVGAVAGDTKVPSVGKTGSSKTVKGGDSSGLGGLTGTLTSTTGGKGLMGEVLDSTTNLLDEVVGAVAGDTKVPSVGKTGSSKTVKGGDSSGLGGLTGTLTSTIGGKGLVGGVLDSTTNLLDEVVGAVAGDTKVPSVGKTGSSKTVKGGDSSGLGGLTGTLTSTTGGKGLVGGVLDSTKNLVDGVVGAVAGDTEVPSVGNTGSSKTVKGGDSSGLGGLTGTLTSTTGGKGLVGGVLDSTKNLVDGVLGAVAGDTEVPSVGKTGSSKTVTSVTGNKGGGSRRLDGVLGTVGSVTGAVTGVVDELPVGDVTSMGPVLESLGAGTGVSGGNAVALKRVKVTLRTLLLFLILRRFGLL